VNTSESELEPEFPLEFIVLGTPVSFQSPNKKSKKEWKERVKAASRAVLPDGHWATRRRLAVTLLYFPDGPMDGDIDNIVKLVMDALNRHIYMDDKQVERLVVQKFEPDNVFGFTSPSPTLEAALRGDKPLLYVRISDRPFEDLT